MKTLTDDSPFDGKLVADQLHIWRLSINDVDPQLLSAYRDLLSPEELQRMGRFKFDHLQRDYAIARALVRTTLSKYVDVAPTSWRFTQGEHGKPEIDHCPVPLRFNLSHTNKQIVCAVMLEKDIGIDIENIERNNDVLSIADRYFSALELKELFSLPVNRQVDRFFDYWTLKEAYMKADGGGISLGLGNFGFSFGDDIAVSFSSKLADSEDQWRFWLFRPEFDHRMALAVRTGVDREVELQQFSAMPLVI